jgi:hypothetical protein
MAKSTGATLIAPRQSAEEISATKLASNQRLMHSMKRALQDLDAGKTVSLDDLSEAVSRKLEERHKAK